MAIRFLRKVRVSSTKVLRFLGLASQQSREPLYRSDRVDLLEFPQKLKAYHEVAFLVTGFGGGPCFMSIAIDSHVLCSSDDMAKR